MQRIFFHNKHDKSSIDILNTLPEDVLIYDIFDKSIPLPDGILIRSVPYLIDREIELITEPPYQTGGFVLQYQCKDYQGNALTESPLFDINIDGTVYREKAVNGILEIEIISATATTVNIRITNDGDGYLTWKGVIQIVTT